MVENEKTFVIAHGWFEGKLKSDGEIKPILSDDDIVWNRDIDSDYDLIKENLINIIEKRSKLNKTNSLYQLKTKLKPELVRLGYDESDISKGLDSLLKDDDSIYQKEYEKLYKKYAKKYEGNEIKYRIKQALYQKGFGYKE